ncbi:NADH-quinone oxidoreductase subunit C (plasmid) [Rhizobium leguminosarum]|uniref:hydrogenase large subunit n=1 Tax=Rhizobium leguminosarum TaxID=384 RepID=UPI0014420D37|nr:NADH-quinone oxidoreductase subunit C [Rhizobium leguminosarum]MBY5835660.1 hydrogenase expression protein HypE [Rhizobium leguminosarum]NKM78295.1 hydrogenase expression protein HypE [Rhizobium leguminosarum bv. viciae]QSZ11958.1 NADH-quinone oxidoreductase subunit C [Rhizobium leguminosarum]
MSALSDLIERGVSAQHHAPWSRAVVDPAIWTSSTLELAERRLTLLGLWGEEHAVHMALLDESASTIAVISLEGLADGYPSVARHHPPALRLERAIHDLTGLEPQDLPDIRPWLDHGRWDLCHPLGKQAATLAKPEPYTFLRAEGDGLHQIPVGPVHAGIIEPGHFRFTANGETVVRLEERLGYVHKGIEALMVGADLLRGAQLAGRTSGDSTVAYAYAFAQAAEAAARLVVPPRAVWLRALMAELERLANHLGDIGAICNDAAFPLMLAHCGVLRERVLRAAETAFGHRLMRDRILPGGVAVNLSEDGRASLKTLLDEIHRKLPALVELYDNTASLQDRTVGTGRLRGELARQYGAGGYVGRASGRGFDARDVLRYPPYDQLSFEVPVLNEGDVNARVWIRIREVEQSLSLLGQILDRLPDGPIVRDIPFINESREGMALVEGFRGDVLVWLRLTRESRIERCHLRDPSWFQWPLLEAAIEGNIVADFPLCNKSFNCSYSGHDL